MRTILSNLLTDPDSLQLEIAPSAVRGAYLSVERGEVRFGWLIATRVNARNAAGGYIGKESYWFFFVDGKPVALTIGAKIYEFNGGGLTAEQAGIK